MKLRPAFPLRYVYLVAGAGALAAGLCGCCAVRRCRRRRLRAQHERLVEQERSHGKGEGGAAPGEKARGERAGFDGEDVEVRMMDDAATPGIALQQGDEPGATEVGPQ